MYFYSLWSLDKFGNTELLEREETFKSRKAAFSRAKTLIKCHLYGIDTCILVRRISTKSRHCVQWKFELNKVSRKAG